MPVNPLVKLQQLRAYYAANPAREVANVNGIACTATACEAAAHAIRTAQSASNQSNTDAGDAQSGLQDGLAAARARVGSARGTRATPRRQRPALARVRLFEMPGSPSTPEVPENVTATAGAAGTHALFIDWDDARRAEGYRVTVTNVAGGAQLASMLTQDSEVSIGNLPAGANVNVTVTARNAAGESQPTAPITAVVP